MKKLLVINYPHLDIGGIENYIYYLIKQQLNCGVEVNWLCDINPRYAKEYEDMLSQPNIKKIPINTHGMYWNKHEHIDFSNYDKVTIISFGLFDQLRAYEIKERNANVTLLYYVPHFTGARIYVEDYAPNFLRKFYKKIVGDIYSNLDESGTLRYFSQKHRESIANNYEISLDMSMERFVPTVIEKLEFDEDRCRRVFNMEKKVILCVTRFEFPHKGFLLGLVKDFEVLCRKYKNLALKIIGYGVDEDRLLLEIKKLPVDIQNKIEITGKVAPEDLAAHYRDAYVNIGVAGGASLGAKNSVVTLAARHYCENCEVYGFMSKEVPNRLGDTPGNAVFPYIEALMDATEDSYLAKCRASYETIHQTEQDSDYIFKDIKDSNISDFNLNAIKALAFYEKFAFKIKR